MPGCVPEVILQEDDGDRIYAADNCGGMERAQLKDKFGETDVDHIALKLYKMFHGEDTVEFGHDEGWTAYKNYKNDYVVEKFRHMGIMVQKMHEDMKFGG
jgi:hypothetical protein